MIDALKDVPAVLRFRDGRTVRCLTSPEIAHERETVRVSSDTGEEDVPFSDLKAIFYLRDQNTPPQTAGGEMKGSRLSVEFADGEVIRGTTTVYNPERNGFFLFPDDTTKSEKVFVVNSAIVSIDVERL